MNIILGWGGSWCRGKIMSTLTPTQLFLKFFTTEMGGEQMQSKGMSGVRAFTWFGYCLFWSLIIMQKCKTDHKTDHA